MSILGLRRYGAAFSTSNGRTPKKLQIDTKSKLGSRGHGKVHKSGIPSTH